MSDQLPEEQLPEQLSSLLDLGGDGPAAPLSGDAAERLIATALQERRTRAGWFSGATRLRSGRALGVVALVLIGSSAAAAWYQHRIELRERELEHAVPDDSAKQPRARTERAQQPSIVPTSEVVANEPAAPASTPDEGAGAESPGRVMPAEDLLQKASRLRREGQAKEAEQTYMQLVQREPQSMSAYVARVAVAELRLGRNPSSAIELLQAAQQRFPSGPLDIEIHQALAQACRGTGNAVRERAELKTLISQHPGTVAADRARARLSELDK
jgi:TolA-binding protein